MKKRLYLLILIMLISTVGKCFGQLEIRIENIKDNWVLGEDYLIKVKFKNISNKTLKVIYSLERFEETIKMNIEPKEGIKKERGLIIDRRPTTDRVPGAKMVYEYNPGWEYTTVIPISMCYILEKAGVYRIKLIYEYKYDGSRVPAVIYEQRGKETIVTPISEVLVGPVESNEIILEIKQPEGIDKQAYEEFKGYPLSYMKELLEKYPTSTYVGWVLLNYLGKPDEWEPEKVVELIENNLYPPWNSVPDPSSHYWKGMSGKELAQWQIKWAESILMAHPDFPYARRFKLIIGTNLIVLGQQKRGLEMLQKSANEKNTVEGEWASKFLSLWK